MKRAPKAPLILVALLCFAGLLKATLPQTVIGKWTAAIGLSQPRANAASVILPDGRILIIGGDGGSGFLQSVEVFGTDGSVSPAAAMNVPRSQHFAVVLSDGRVLVGGGVSSGGGTTNSGEIYDSSADTWTKTSVMAEARANATAALLQDGRVLIAGGDNSGSPSNTLEIFDPSNGSFAFAGTLSAARTKHAMAVLKDGRVLIVGGFDGNNPLASTDIFDPSSGSVSAGPTLATARYSASATTLLNGQVAVMGGAGSDGNGGTTDLASAEIFDPSSGAFTTAGATLTTAREAHQAYLLPKNNSVLIVGGTSSGTTVAASELFTPQASPSSGAWTYGIATTGSNVTPRSAATGSAMQQDGLLLAAGGTDASGNTLASTELYAFPTVKTDQADYPPGTTVNITGRGFQPNETVTITLVESPLFDTHGPYTITADSNGNISDSSFTTDIHDENVRFWLSATGSQSGLVAQNTFTDAVNVNTSVASSNNPSVVGQSVTLTATATQNGNGSPITCGTIQFKDNGNDLGSSLTLNGISDQVSLSTTALTQGSHTIIVVYSGSTGCTTNNNNTDNPLTQLVAGAATKVVFVQEPTAATAGQSISPAVTVQVEDANGTLVSNSSASITVAIGANPGGGTLSGTPTQNAVNGVATFGGLSINKTGTGYTLTASSTGLTQATSTAFNIIAGTATQLAFTTQPSNSTGGVAFPTQPVVTLEDTNGNAVTGTPQTVTLAIQNNAGPGGTLSGTRGVAVNTTTGQATFSGLSIDKPGNGYTLTATGNAIDTTAGAVVSAPFNISVGPAAKLAFTASPSSSAVGQAFATQPSVTVEDAGNNPVTNDSSDAVTLTITTGTGTSGAALSCTTNPLTVTGGVVSFSGCNINTAGNNYSLTAKSGTLTSATSNAFNITQASTTTTVASSANPSVFGQLVTFTATVTGSGTPTGTVTFKDGTTTLGTGALSTTGGVTTAKVSTSVLSVASHSITAVYGGDNNFTGSTSSPLPQTVNQASTTTKLASSTNPSNFGQSVTFTATVAAVSPGAGNATGTLIFTDGTTTLGTGTLSTTGGLTTATFTTSTLAVGSHPINASYGGDTNFTGSSTATALIQTVNTATTTTTVASSANPAVAGQVITLTATVTPSGGGTPTGSVAFKDSGITFGSGTLSTTGGVTTATVIVIQSVGSHSITASYSGDSNFSGSTSSVLTQTVDKANTTTTLASAPNPSVFDSPVTFTVTVAAVAPGAGPPSGTVTLTMGNTVEGTGTLSTSGAVTTATIIVSTLPVGSNGLKASYGGDSNFIASSTPNALSQTVTTAPTTTTLASSVNPSVFGQSVTFTATVSVNAPSTGTIPAAETVTFKDNGTTIGTGTTNASGVATFTTSSLTAATHPITATYSGDTNFATSTSSAVSQVVNPAPTATALASAPNPSVFGQSVTFTATVTVSSPGVGTIPAGDTVTFKDGPNTLGTGSTNASGVATFTTSALTAATHSVTAVYAGDTSFATSTSNTVSQVVNRANTTTTLASSLNPSASGQSVTFTATVAAVAPGSGNPTGTVTFKDGANAIGTGTLSTTAGVTTATFSTSALTSGSHSITAVYGSDTNFSGSTSSALTQNVLSPPSILKAFGAATIPLNGTTSLTFTITNPAGNTVALNGLAFTDSLPAGLIVASTPNISNTCGGTFTASAGSGSVSLSGGTVAASSSCSISVNVTGTSVGQKNNTTGAVSSTNDGTGNTASASIIVDAPPTISKAFGAAQINLNTSTSLTFTITNPNATSLSGIAVSDSLPSGLVVASPAGFTGSCGSGTISATAGSSLVALSGGTLAGNGQCVFSVNVTGTSTGAKLNTTGAITSTEGGTGATSNTATLNVVGTPPTITSGNSATFTAGVLGSFTVATSGTPTASLSFSGTLPTGVGFTDNGNGTATISGTATTSGNYPITITAQNGVPANATQTFTLMVNAGALATITLTPANATITAGGNESYAAAGFDKFGNSIGDVTSATTFTVTGGTCLSNSCSSTLAGTQTVTGNDGGIIGSAMLNEMPGAITHLALSPATASITAGGSQSYTALGLDIYNNGAGDVTSLTTFTISPGGSCTGASCTSNVAGTETVTGTYTNGSQGTATLTVTAGSFTHLQLLVPGETAAPGTATGKTGTPNVEYVNGPFNVTVNAVDQFFNVVSGASDTVHFASNDTDPNTKLPSDAALVNGTGALSVTLETVSYNPNKTTITVTDVTNNSITSDTSPAIEVIEVYTASITPTMAGTGDATTYTLIVNNAQAPNTNNLESVQVSVPSADQGTIASGVSVTASNGGPALNWTQDMTKLPGTLRFSANSDAEAVTPGGTITITFTATSNAPVTTVPVSEQWITNGFSDAASNNGLPLAGPEPTVQIGSAPKITSLNTATFTFGTTGTSFTVTTSGVPTPTVSESGSLAPGLMFTANLDGTATISGTPTAAGSYPITITAHSGFGPDTTQTLTIVVNKADSVSTVVSNAEPSVFGQSVTFTATVSAVSPATGTPTGTVQFMDGGSPIGTPQTLSSYGKATMSTSSLSVASHLITAVYSGDTNFNKTGADSASTAIAFTQDVNKADTSSTVVSSVNPSVFGQSVTFTATVTPVAPGAGMPTGTAQFMDGGTPVGSPQALDASGHASFSTTSLTVATHSIKAVYSGDGDFNTSTSAAVNQIANKADSSSTVASSVNLSVYGQSVTFTATVTAVAPASGTPGGSVQFMDGTTPISSLQTLDASGHASYSTSSLNAATHYIKAVYGGDSNFNSTGFDAASTATAVAQVVNKANAVITVTGYSATYTATPYMASGSAMGVFGEVLSGLNLSGTTHTAAGTYTDTWTFTDTTGNYNNTSGMVTDSIAKANPTVVVMPYDVVYDTNPHTAAGTATGVLGEALSGLNLTGTTHAQAGTFVDTWTFVDVTGNYNNATGAVTDAIEKATPVITWNTPANITYGTALSATQLNATANVPGTFAYNPTFGTVLKAGSGQPLVVLFTPTDAVDYNTANANQSINVNPVTPRIIWSNPADITYPTALSSTQLDAIVPAVPLGATGWWTADEGVGTTAQNSAGADSATLKNGASFAPGEYNTAFSLVASQQQYVDAGNTPDLQVSQGDFSVAAWVNFTSLSGDMSIMDKMGEQSSVNDDGWRLLKQGDGHFGFCIGQTPGANSCGGVHSNTLATTGTWFHVAAVKTAGTIYIYVNGVLENSAPVGPINDDNQPHLLFGSYMGQSAFMDGEIDEVQLFNHALSATEIQTIYNGTVSGNLVYTPASGTVLHAGPNQTLSSSFTPTDTTDYNSASKSVSINVLKGNQTITFAALANHTYGDAPFMVSATGGGSGNPVTFSATGNCASSGTNGSTITITGAGSCTVTADEAGNSNYNAAASVPQTFSIAKANALIKVTPYSVTYDGNAHTATGSATGVFGEVLSGVDVTGTTHTAAGAYNSDPWTFTDSTGNYNDASGTVSDSIAKADAKISVTQYSVTYDSNVHTATGTAVGVESMPVDLSSLLHLGGTTHTNAGDYLADSWTFDGNGNYNAASGTVHDAIAKANAAITVTPYNVTYDGNAHTATSTITGVKGEALSGLNLTGTTHTAAGTYNIDPWIFTDSTGNYNNANGTVNDSIAKANAAVTVSPYSVTYDGNSHTATGSATGVKGESLSGLNLNGSAHTYAGSYTDTWTFTDVTGNYNNGTGTVTDSIAQAPSATTVYCPMTVTYNAMAQTPCTAAATGVGGLNAALPVGYSANVSAGPVTASASFGGDMNHTASMGSATFTINPATTATTVMSSPNPSNWTNVVTLTANVVNSSGTNVQPVGSVYFYNNAPSGSSCNSLLASATSPIGIGAVTGVTDTTVTNYLNTSTATITTPGLPVGADTILACYNYNPADMTYTANFNASSGITSQTVNPAPVVTLLPTSLSFGTQAAGTKSGVQSVTICNGPSAGTCAGVPTATAALSISSIGFGGNNPGDFIFTTSPANNCGGSIANGGSCVVNVQFAPQSNSSGVESAFLNLTDNNVNIAGSVQSASVTGAGLSVIGPVAGSFSTYAIAATNNNCSAVNISGNGTVDGFNGATNSGNVAINGNASLNGGPVINGTLYSLFGTTGSCTSKSMTGATITGKAQITGGEKLLSGTLNFALPATFSGVTTSSNITSCPSGLTGCFNTGTKTVSLAPGQYGNLTISGGTVAHVSAGTYNINSLTLTGNSVLYVDSGPVVINLAGTGLSANSAVLDSSGGSILNSTGKTSNLGIYYAGSNVMKLSGGSGTYALVYAPNAAVSMTGGSHFYGSIVANTVNSSGNTAIHGDLGAASIAAGNTLWLSSSGLKVQGLPSNQTVKLYVTNASVTYTANGGGYTVPVPNAVITFSPTATSASTTWDAANSRWSTLVPTSSVSGNSTIHTFFDAVAIPVPAGGFPNGIQNVSLQAAYSTTSTGFTFNWQWGAAVYSGTMPAAGDYSTFNVNPLDSTVPAGTPVTYESSLLFGDMGPGYVGMYEGSTSVVPTIAPASIAPSSWNFGTVSKGTTSMVTQSFTLSNNQSGLLTMSSTMNPPIVISGTNAADFSWTSNCPGSGATMTGGSSCTINITYTVNSTAGVLEKAKLSVYNNAANSPQTVFLQATGAP